MKKVAFSTLITIVQHTKIAACQMQSNLDKFYLAVNGHFIVVMQKHVKFGKFVKALFIH